MRTAFTGLTQADDGSFKAPDRTIGATAWVILAMVGEGNTRHAGRDSASLAKAVAWLVAIQNADGSFGKARDPDFAIDHVVAALALVELWLAERERDLEPKAVAAVRSVAASLENAVSLRQHAIAVVLERVVRSSDGSPALLEAGRRLQAKLAAVVALHGADPQAAAVIQRLGAGRVKAPADPSPPWPDPLEEDPLGTFLAALSHYEATTPRWRESGRVLEGVIATDEDRTGTWAPRGMDSGLGRAGVSAVLILSLELYYSSCRLRLARLD